MASPRKGVQSNPDLSQFTEFDQNTISRKRKSPEDYLGTQIESLITMFHDFKQEQKANFDKVNDNILQLKEQNANVFSTLTVISEQQTQLQARVETLEVKEETAAAAVDAMGSQLELLQRKLIATSVEIRNIPTDNNEQAIAAVGKIHTALDLEFNSCFIRSVFRARGKQNEQRPIVVEFNTVTQKNFLLQAIKKFNTTHKTDKFNTGHIGYLAKNPVYINERLTPKCSHLRFLARSGVKKGLYFSSWTSGGRLYVRKEEGQPGVEITDAKQLETLIA